MKKNRLIALFTTVANMEAQQLTQTAKRKLKSTFVPHLPIRLDERYQPEVDSESVDFTPIKDTNQVTRNTFTKADRISRCQQVTSLEQGSIQFLNRSIKFRNEIPNSIDPLIGTERGYPRLWTLKLVSFEPASWLLFSSRDKRLRIAKKMVEWLKYWQAAEITTIGSTNYLRRYWTPYAVSRRIDNLAILGAILEDLPGDHLTIVADHLAKNVHFLCNHIEYDIGGNHLLENGIALVLGGVILDDDDTVSRGLNLLSSELASQLLNDGMHFERSPMYHSILLYRTARCLDALRQSGRKPLPGIVPKVNAMYACLRDIAPGTANYPLLNDSVYEESPSRQSCLSFVDEIFEVSNGNCDDRLCGDSGYYSLESGPATILIDGGVPCPNHLPAHAHNDIGNVVLWVGEEPFITDTGVYDYQPGNRRNYARSVEAHNTVQINDGDQTVTHGRFMMGPRPTPVSNSIAQGSDRKVTVQYRSPPFVHPYTHKRIVKPIEQGIQIEDQVNTDEDSVTSRLHLAPGCDPVVNGNTVIVEKNVEHDIEIVVSGAESVNIVDNEYYPQYGMSVSRPTIEMICQPKNNKVCISHDVYCR